MEEESEKIELGVKTIIEARAAEYARKHIIDHVQKLDRKLQLLINRIDDGFSQPANDEPQLVSREEARFILGVDRSTQIAREKADRLPRPDRKVGRQKAYLRQEFDRTLANTRDTSDPRRYVSRLRIYQKTGWSISTLKELESSGRLPPAVKLRDGAPWAYRRSDLEPRAQILGIDLGE